MCTVDIVASVDVYKDCVLNVLKLAYESPLPLRLICRINHVW